MSRRSSAKRPRPRPTRSIDAALLGDSEALEAGLDRLRAEGGFVAALGAQALRHLIQLQGLRATLDAGASATARPGACAPADLSGRRASVEAALSRWPADSLDARRRMVDRAICADAGCSRALESAVDLAARLHASARCDARRLR